MKIRKASDGSRGIDEQTCIPQLLKGVWDFENQFRGRKQKVSSKFIV